MDYQTVLRGRWSDQADSDQVALGAVVRAVIVTEQMARCNSDDTIGPST